MSADLTRWIDLYTFPIGRRQFALRQLAAAADAIGWAELAAECRACVAFDEETRTLQRQRDSQQALPADPRLTELDNQIDRTLTVLGRHWSDAVQLFDDAEAKRLLNTYFPNGTAALVNLPFEEELTAVQSILDGLNGADAAAAEATRALHFIAHLGGLAEAFQEALDARSQSDLIDAKTLRLRRDEGQHRLLAIVAQILGRYPRASDADTQARAALLAPIERQRERLGAIYRKRARVSDVDPSTGAELPDVVDVPDS